MEFLNRNIESNTLIFPLFRFLVQPDNNLRNYTSDAMKDSVIADGPLNNNNNNNYYYYWYDWWQLYVYFWNFLLWILVVVSFFTFNSMKIKKCEHILAMDETNLNYLILFRLRLFLFRVLFFSLSLSHTRAHAILSKLIKQKSNQNAYTDLYGFSTRVSRWSSCRNLRFSRSTLERNTFIGCNATTSSAANNWCELHSFWLVLPLPFLYIQTSCFPPFRFCLPFQ